MPFGVDFWVLKALGFFIAIVIDFAEFIVNQPYAVWYIGHISAMSLVVFSFGFFWVCLWKTRWRLIGLVIMLIGAGLMFTARSPDFVYDYNIKVVAINDREEGLKIYSNSKLPKFTSDYWAGWFGYQDAKIIEMPIVAKDRLYILNDGNSVSLNYWSCQESDIGIVTSKKLKCGKNQNIISNGLLWQEKQILVYCKKSGGCTVDVNN